MLGAGEDELAWLGVLVYDLLKVAAQVGDPLHLVEDRPLAVLVEKTARVVERVVAGIAGFKRNVRPVGEGGTAQRRLA